MSVNLTGAIFAPHLARLRELANRPANVSKAVTGLSQELRQRQEACFPAVNQTSTTKQAVRLTRRPYRETMRQTTPTLPISPKMLRHFAVVTVVVTSMLGIFAQGENTKVAESAAGSAPASSGGGSFLEFGGAEKAALAGPAKEAGQVGGMQLAKGTSLQADDGGGGGDGGGGSSESVTGSIQLAPPAPRRIIFGPGVHPPADTPSPADGPPPMPKDAHGVPAPGIAIPGVGAGAGAKPQAPRRPTAQDIQRVLAASGQRSGNSPK